MPFPSAQSPAAGCIWPVAQTASTDPTLIWPAPEATARSARKESSVSPERAEITAPYPASRARSITANVWLRVPI